MHETTEFIARLASAYVLVIGAVVIGIAAPRASARSHPGPAVLPAGPRVSQERPGDLHHALDDFQSAIDGRWSYRRATDADLDAAVAALRVKVDAGIAPNAFGIELQKIIALGIDGHASVSGYDLPGTGHLPFLIEPVGERFLAIRSDRSGFLVDGFPFVTTIDGRDVADWCAAAEALVPKGSPQYVRRHCLRLLRELDYLRTSMGLPVRATVDVELAGPGDLVGRSMRLPVAPRAPRYGTWPRGGSRRLEGNIGYLRLAAMNRGAVGEIEAWMPRFKDTAGLIVDVRDNGGGSREALRRLYDYLAAPDDPPRVFTAAAYRLHPAHGPDHLAARFMYRADDERWTDVERRAIAAFARTFEPEWRPPEGRFSAWHYMVLTRGADPGVSHYPGPVVVLMNAKCFSATDIFLAGLQGMSNVTLLGTASGGGSARSQRVALGDTPLELRIGSMASFRADGRLYDGRGVQPDVTVTPGPEYYLDGGRDDALIEAAKGLEAREVSDQVGTTPVERPNVIVILSDDQGWADIGYNNPGVHTPNLDRLAGEGATLVNHYVMPQCTPTRVAVMTGRYPGRFGPHALQASNLPAFPLGTPTLAGMFKACGYETFLSGKWHLGSAPEHGPNHFGFDGSYGSLAGAVGMYDHRYRRGEYEHTWHRDHVIIEGGENGVHATDLVAREAIRFIERERDRPFFLYLAFHAPHTPLDERGDFVGQPTTPDPDDPQRWLNEHAIRWFNDPDGKIQSEPDPEKRLLLAAVHHLDRAVGSVVDALERTGRRRDTLILFSSDNGPQGSWPGQAYPDDLELTDFNQPLPMRGRKLDVWEGGIHVPAFANWPGRIAPGKITDPVHIIDWFPTLASLLGYRPAEPIPWDGVDLLPALLGDEAVEERDLYWIWNRRTDRWAVRLGDWKIVKYGEEEPAEAGAWKLFNLSDDPEERDDVAGEHPEIVARLHRRFSSQRAKDRR